MDPAIFAGVLVRITIAVLFERRSSIEHRLNRFSRIDAKLDALLKNGGITFDELHDLPLDVRQALEGGHAEAVQRGGDDGGGAAHRWRASVSGERAVSRLQARSSDRPRIAANLSWRCIARR